MIILITVLTLINIPVGYFVCRRLNLTSYFKILFVGLAQYLISSFLMAFWMVAEQGDIFSKTRILEFLAVWFYGSAVYLLFVFPIIALTAWGIRTVLLKKQT